MPGKLWCIAVMAGALVWNGCSTATSTIPPNALVLTGRINPLLGPDGTTLCWVLEVGSDLRSLKYYQLDGPDELLRKLRYEDARVTLRVVVRTDISTDCPVGAVAYIYEILSLSTLRD